MSILMLSLTQHPDSCIEYHSFYVEDDQPFESDDRARVDFGIIFEDFVLEDPGC